MIWEVIEMGNPDARTETVRTEVAKDGLKKKGTGSLKETMEASVRRKEEAAERRRKNSRPKKVKPLTENDLMKLEIARELGFEDRIQAEGFGALTARETGRIGGIMTARKKEAKRKSIEKKEENDFEGEKCCPSLHGQIRHLSGVYGRPDQNGGGLEKDQ